MALDKQHCESTDGVHDLRTPAERGSPASFAERAQAALGKIGHILSGRAPEQITYGSESIDGKHDVPPTQDPSWKDIARGNLPSGRQR